MSRPNKQRIPIILHQTATVRHGTDTDVSALPVPATSATDAATSLPPPVLPPQPSRPAASPTLQQVRRSPRLSALQPLQPEAASASGAGIAGPAGHGDSSRPQSTTNKRRIEQSDGDTVPKWQRAADDKQCGTNVGSKPGCSAAASSSGAVRSAASGSSASTVGSWTNAVREVATDAAQIAAASEQFMRQFNADGSKAGQLRVCMGQGLSRVSYRPSTVALLSDLRNAEPAVRAQACAELRKLLVDELMYVSAARNSHETARTPAFEAEICKQGIRGQCNGRTCNRRHVNWKCDFCGFHDWNVSVVRLDGVDENAWSVQAGSRRRRKLVLAPKPSDLVGHLDNISGAARVDYWTVVLKLCRSVAKKIEMPLESAIESVNVHFGWWEKIGCSDAGHRGHAHFHIVLTREASERIDETATTKECALWALAGNNLTGNDEYVNDWLDATNVVNMMSYEEFHEEFIDLKARMTKLEGEVHNGFAELKQDLPRIIAEVLRSHQSSSGTPLVATASAGALIVPARRVQP